MSAGEQPYARRRQPWRPKIGKIVGHSGGIGPFAKEADMARLLIAAVAVAALWYAYMANEGRRIHVSGAPFGGISAAPGAIVDSATGAAANIGN